MVIVLRITDDGVVGRQALAGTGMGLGIMRHRARLIAAQIVLGHRKDGVSGWEVIVTLSPSESIR